MSGHNSIIVGYPNSSVHNKVLLVTAMFPDQHITYGCFLNTRGEVSTRGHKTHKVRHLYYLALYRKMCPPLLWTKVKHLEFALSPESSTETIPTA